MILLNTRHPDFDLSMEVLATLSTYSASLRSIARDFGYDNTREIQVAINRLKTNGFSVTIGNRAGKRMVWLDGTLNYQEELQVEMYLYRVYADPISITEGNDDARIDAEVGGSNPDRRRDSDYAS